MSFHEMKQQESQSRMAAVRRLGAADPSLAPNKPGF
jgi:hypothetical protein